ncbi:MAG: hypothetical protein A2Y13_09260 [Planctomycetes bacterium GWC2_45_44]|nr:MAG: hypothetical protein A2Y13_09260 [Planctomycetes bacterium GWC2_45_44]HBR20156.1 hypothetical protein [Phycisphaerales bacterium]
MNTGKKVWVFPDGDLPQPGNKEPFGHESLVILNMNEQDTTVEFDIYFDKTEPVKNIKSVIKAERVRCFRLDKPVGEQKYKIPFGQYALVVRSQLPVVAQIGRMDITQPNLAYYTTMGYALD